MKAFSTQTQSSSLANPQRQAKKSQKPQPDKTAKNPQKPTIKSNFQKNILEKKNIPNDVPKKAVDVPKANVSVYIAFVSERATSAEKTVDVKDVTTRSQIKIWSMKFGKPQKI